MRVTDPQRFDGFAAAYDRHCELTDRPLWPSLEGLGITGGARALDLGCGSGRSCVQLAERYGEVVGVDLSAPMIDLARQRRPRDNLRYIAGDLTTFEDNEGFDLVYSSTALHHVPDLDAGLAHIRSLVRPGGYAVLVDNLWRAPDWKAWAFRHGGVYASPFLNFRGALRQHGLRDALEISRFGFNRQWVRHLVSDRWLKWPEFEDHYARAFPGGQVGVMNGFGLLTWQAPAPD